MRTARAPSRRDAPRAGRLRRCVLLSGGAARPGAHPHAAFSRPVGRRRRPRHCGVCGGRRYRQRVTGSCSRSVASGTACSAVPAYSGPAHADGGHEDAKRATAQSRTRKSSIPKPPWRGRQHLFVGAGNGVESGRRRASNVDETVRADDQRHAQLAQRPSMTVTPAQPPTVGRTPSRPRSSTPSCGDGRLGDVNRRPGMSAIVTLPIARNANGWARTGLSRPVGGSRSCIGRHRSVIEVTQRGTIFPIRADPQTLWPPPGGGPGACACGAGDADQSESSARASRKPRAAAS